MQQCSIYEKCGGCQNLHLPYEKQCQQKKEACIHYLKKERLSLKVMDTTPSPSIYHYRNKMIIAFKKGRRGMEAGLYEESTHRILPYQSCLLHEKTCDELIKFLIKLIEKYRIPIYDEDRRYGNLRHILIRYGVKTKQILVTLVCQENGFKGSKSFCQDIVKAYPQVKSIVLNINKRKTSIVLGDEEKILYGSGFIYDELCGLRFKISSSSFYQINHDQCENLYQKAIELMDLKGNETIIDAYCGIGTIGLCASEHAKQVIGVELNRQAIKDAKVNASINQRKNISFVCDDAPNYMVQLAKEKVKIDAVFMDPPRAGSTEIFVSAIKELKPKKVVYISCNPETMARDLVWFKNIGYHFDTLYPFDMFPHTKHIEAIVCLKRR